MNLSKNTPLEKKGKFTTTKNNQIIKFPNSNSNMKL